MAQSSALAQRPAPMPRLFSRGALALILAVYTLYTLGPFLWLATMSVRTTAEISADHYAWPRPFHWEQFRSAWVDSDFATYFWNSTLVVVGAVAVVTLIGAAAAHALARYRFRGNRLIYGILFSSIIFPPQITLISLYQILVDYNLYNSLLGLSLVYVSLQLPLTVYLLEGFFARIPQDLFDAAKMDGYGDLEIFWRIVLPVGMPAIATTLILNFIQLWNEFLFAVVLITDPEKRTLPIGIRAFMGDHFQDIGMIATGVMISVIPVIIAYVFFSEKLIRGMTAGAIK
ncbi:ABC-type glycerol-3-phosphate transport system permease component [Bosea sp. BE125]|uniref:carbohydrate ABC transporter permease n=1 Tax=Bosea sp. BE125 TaxID=2817909 RepID=UPI00285F6091|nr:carbohydrate ABC transporter permease [Bosea sp. BE125]MDR6870080.1 ABC-type glycerol-3-phosphate transport system permease component [Bosea sp. BE125]